MRVLPVIFALTCFISAGAQTQLPGNGMHYGQRAAFGHYNILQDSNRVQKKWSVSGYTGFGAGMGFLSGGNTAFFPAQIGLQLNRRLHKNLYAFAGVVATPGFFNFNRSFSNAELHRNAMMAPGLNGNGFGVYSGIQAGLMYVNDAKTFSISGSIGISNSNPFYPANSVSTQKQPAFTRSRQ